MPQPDPGYKDWQRRQLRRLGRVPVTPSLAIEAPLPVETTADRLERFLPDVTLIGPTAGAELHALVYGGDAS